MPRKKLNEGKVKKLLDISKEAVDKIEKDANSKGLTFKYCAQNIIEKAAKKLK